MKKEVVKYERSKLPDWLTDKTVPAKPVTLSPQGKDLLQFEYEQMFEVFVEQICRGVPLRLLIEKNTRIVSYEDFIRWIKRDPVRHERYKEAQEFHTEIMAGEILEISDGIDHSTGELSMEDVHRSKLKVETRKWLMGVWNRKRYTETKQIEFGGNISITKALEQAESRVILDAECRVIDAED